MTEPPVRQQIIEAVRDRLQDITTLHEFETDAGNAVYVGERPELGESDPEAAIALLIGVDQIRTQTEQLLILLPLEIHALAKVDLERQGYLTAEQVLGDIKRAVELTDRTLGGLVKRQIQRGATRVVERRPGSTTVGIAITYFALYTELWGNP